MQTSRVSIAVIACLIVPMLTAAQKAPKPAELLETLNRGSKYDDAQPVSFPPFTYQDRDDANLTALRKKYNLDSVAGQGTDIVRATNLLQWMHRAVPHEDEYNHHLLTADNVIDTYRQKGTAQGCYPLAIAMNDIFLSMGFRSRTVICFSSDYAHPRGGHVITVVYIPSLRKWVWMDPQFNAFLKDGAGNLLDVAEVRQRIIRKERMYLNPLADYHGKPVTAKYYLYRFMLEHMYRFICPLNSAYNSQTRDSGKSLTYVELLPTDSQPPTTGQFESHSKNGVQVTTYHTNNARAFWQIPAGG